MAEHGHDWRDLDLAPGGRSLIEASAGTGKTWTIAALYLRLLLEGDVPYSPRQIVVAKGIAYISAREDGLFVVDVRQPRSPRLLCHYDAVEFATGLAVSGDVLFIAHRQFGVELVDISNPAKPAHLSTLRTGEAQSVVVRDGWLYTGVWGTSEVVVANVKNARAPVITAKVPLDGFGDGVDLRGNYLFADGHVKFLQASQTFCSNLWNVDKERGLNSGTQGCGTLKP